MNFKIYLKRGIHYVLHGIPEVTIKADISYISSGEFLRGKRIVVTGGGRGLGLAMAKKFQSEGARVLIAGRNIELLKKIATQYDFEYCRLDVQDVSSFADFWEEVFHKLGWVDALVNNAGISLHEGNIRNVSSSDFDNQFATNLKGGYFLTQQLLNFYEDKGGKGDVLFVSSERGECVDELPYGLTKVAVNSLVQALAKRYIKKGIRVNAVAPGVTASEMTGFDPSGNLYYDFNINNRIYLPEEVAEVACFLLSDASKCLNGQILVCNEGKTIN